MIKGQSQILGAVLITAIVLLVSGSAFIWGKPLIDKSTDKSKIDGLVLKMAEIDSSIKQAASTGSSKNIRLRLGESDEISLTKEGELKLTTYTKVPVISTRELAPLNSYELSTKKDLIGVETSNTVNPVTYDQLASYTFNSSFSVKNASVILDGNYYNVLSYVTSSKGDYDFICITNVTSSKPKNNECAFEFQVINIGEVSYTIQSVDPFGEFVYFTGRNVENVGVITRDVPGVIAGKSRVIGSNEGLLTTLSLDYRGLQDDSGIVHRIILQCSGTCLSTKPDSIVKLYRADVARTGDSIDTYINIEFD